MPPVDRLCRSQRGSVTWLDYTGTIRSCLPPVSAKLGCHKAMDHVEHVLMVGTSMQIRIAWRIRGEDRERAALSQVNAYMAAVCKTAPFALLPSVPSASQFPVRAGPELRTGMDDLRA